MSEFPANAEIKAQEARKPSLLTAFRNREGSRPVGGNEIYFLAPVPRKETTAEAQARIYGENTRLAVADEMAMHITTMLSEEGAAFLDRVEEAARLDCLRGNPYKEERPRVLSAIVSKVARK